MAMAVYGMGVRFHPPRPTFPLPLPPLPTPIFPAPHPPPLLLPPFLPPPIYLSLSPILSNPLTFISPTSPLFSSLRIYPPSIAPHPYLSAPSIPRS